jgi:DNA-directed RNA polymerase beta' subunit
VLDYAGRIVQEETNVDNNTIFAMALCASKGTPINTSQIRGCIGQQSNEGQRIHSNNKHGIDGGRTLPSFAAGEKSALSRGFVGTNYRDGASP